jgi:2TM domain
MSEGPHTVNVEAHQRELRARALDRIRRRRNFVTHLFATLLGSLLVTIIWATTEYSNAGGWPTGFRTGRNNHDWDPWIMYPLAAGAVALAVHAWIAFGRRPPTEREIDGEIKRIQTGSYS